MHCSNLAADALKRAIADYLKKAGRFEDLKRLGLDDLSDEDEHDDHGELCPM